MGKAGAGCPLVLGVEAITAPPPPTSPAIRQQEGPRVHLLGQSPLLGPAADVAAQESQRGLVLDGLLLHGLDLQRPTLLCGRGRGRAVGCGPRAGPGFLVAEAPGRGGPEWGHEFAVSKPMQLPPSLHGGPLRCPAVLSVQGRIGYPLQYSWASLLAQLVKNLPAMLETWVRSLGWEDCLEEGMATHSSILAWRIPWTV